MPYVSIDDLSLCPLARNVVPVEHFMGIAFDIKGSEFSFKLDFCCHYLSKTSKNLIQGTIILDGLTGRYRNVPSIRNSKYGEREILKAIVAVRPHFHQNTFYPHIIHPKYEAGVVQ